MPSTYTTNLKLELIPTGAQSGIWGATTNVNLGSSTSTQSGIEQAIVGLATCATGDFVSNVATYTLADSNASQVARNFVLNITATLTAAGTVNVPAINKPYLVFNNSVGGFAVTVKVSGQTGVSIPNGRKAWLYNNGTDVGVAFDYAPSLALGTALTTTSGGTGLSAFTAGDVPYYASGTALSKLGIGANTFVMTSTGSAPQWVSPSTIAVGTATTATNLAGGAANRIAYQTGAGTTSFAPAPTTSNYVLTWNGTTIDWASVPSVTTAGNLTGGSAGVVPYQSGASTTSFTSVGTTGQVLTSNGTSAPTWSTVDALPSQAGNAGKYLTTNGATASWQDTGASAQGVIWENSLTISTNYTLTTGKNGMSVGPITIDSGVTVTVPSGQRWVVL